MLKLIAGIKGTGKTKELVDMINASMKTTTGDLVCVDKTMKLIHEVNYKVRLVDTDRFNISGYEALYGFIAGMLAGNYDIKEVFVDSTIKIGGENLDELGAFFDKLTALAGDDVKLVFTLSRDVAELPESVKKYL
jgi:hypothetical protein